jgi:predicted cupin superfamily sugar epimerase
VDAQDLIRSLHLAPLSFEGGFFRETHRSRASTAIYFLLTEASSSRMHRLKSEEVYHFYLGDPVELLSITEGTPGEVIVLGRELDRGQRLQHVVPARAWQGSRVLPGGRWALLGTTVAPPFEVSDFEAADRADLVRAHPRHRTLIEALT